MTGAHCGERWNAEQDSHRDIQEIRTFSIGLAIQLGTTVYSVYTDSNSTDRYFFLSFEHLPRFMIQTKYMLRIQKVCSKNMFLVSLLYLLSRGMNPPRVGKTRKMARQCLRDNVKPISKWSIWSFPLRDHDVDCKGEITRQPPIY